MSKQADLLMRKEAGRREQEKHIAFEKRRPYLLNYMQHNSKDLKRQGLSLSGDVDAYVADLMGNDDLFKTHMLQIQGQISKEKIMKIGCPVCGAELQLHKHWDAFICNCTGKKAIYEIREIVIPSLVKVEIRKEEIKDEENVMPMLM